jgi:hypothetical protein
MGPVIIAENVGAIRSVDSGEESGACGDAGGVANAPDDVGTSRACSNVASRRDEAPGAVEILEEAIADLDAGRTVAARARLKAFVAATRPWRRGR